jgi:hypothetical protein
LEPIPRDRFFFSTSQQQPSVWLLGFGFRRAGARALLPTVLLLSVSAQLVRVGRSDWIELFGPLRRPFALATTGVLFYDVGGWAFFA